MNKKKLLVVIVVMVCILLGLSHFAGWLQERYRHRQTSITSSSPISAIIPAPSNIVMTDDSGTLTSLPFPKGMIMIWYGSLANIPPGWVLCDGSNDTPDLRGRFVIGANPNEKRSADMSLSIREIDSKGGTETHTLSIDEIPSHNHTLRNAYGGGSTNDNSSQWDRNTVVAGSINNTSHTGGGKPHNNMPPFYALAYVMKI